MVKIDVLFFPIERDNVIFYEIKNACVELNGMTYQTIRDIPLSSEQKEPQRNNRENKAGKIFKTHNVRRCFI